MILFYNPVSSPSRKPVMPLALLAVGAMLEGWEDYRIIDGNLVPQGLAALRQAIVETGADILCLTVMPGPQLTDAVPICKALKAEFPSLIIVWGGYFPTLHGQILMREPYVDYLFRGHCELAFSDFVRKIRAGEDVTGLPGLGWRDAEGAVHLNPKPPVPDINALPDFPYHRVDMDVYARPSFLGSRTMAHHASYGCPFQCNFCAVVHKVNGRYSAQTAERAAAVVERLVRDHGATAVEFYDNNFFVNEARCAEFAERITPLGIGWWGFGRADTMLKFSDDTWTKLSRSGLKMVFMGAESGDAAMLERMNKGGKQDGNTILAVAEKMRRFGVVPEMSFIIGNPPDPEKDAENTIQFIRMLKNVNPATEIVIYIYSPVPVEGAMSQEAEAAGFEYPKDVTTWTEAKWEKFAQHLSSDLPWMNDRIRRKIANFQRVLHARYPTITDTRLGGIGRVALRVLASWRYRAQFYDFPVELRLLNKLFPHRRPEIQGF
ncbi:radical SAM protein [Nitrospirillum sp. BR 11752]|uniref:B12-binding domain-containing radical SAM protein n=1 Tax=Nitrospirillum sp. BR 11752 TaxID=3104293 RepID=UPI002EBC171B|nr:radical SAM protein [Nitrospirillum sp. BR 11752]